MNPAPRIATLIIQCAARKLYVSSTRRSSSSARGTAGPPATEVAGFEPVVHVLHVAHEIDDGAGRPPEELLALLGRRLAWLAPDAAAVLQQRPERAGRRQEERIEERERVGSQLGQLRREVADAIHVAELLADCKDDRRLADVGVDARAPGEVLLGLLGLHARPVRERVDPRALRQLVVEAGH